MRTTGFVLCMLAVILVVPTAGHADEFRPKNHVFDLGLGAGLDYGGIAGVKLAAIPIPYVSVFGAAGFQLVGLGWNTGACVHIVPQNSSHVFRPNLKIMYGVNAVTMVVGKDGYNKMFLGPTPGVGFEFMFGAGKNHGFDVDVNFPIRSKDFDDQVDEMKADPEVGEVAEPLPFAVSVGYHREF